MDLSLFSGSGVGDRERLGHCRVYDFCLQTVSCNGSVSFIMIFFWQGGGVKERVWHCGNGLSSKCLQT